MDAVAPALIGIGIYLMYEAWVNPTPAPLQKFLTALGNQPSSGATPAPGSPSQPGQTGYGAAIVPVSPAGVAGG